MPDLLVLPNPGHLLLLNFSQVLRF